MLEKVYAYVVEATKLEMSDQGNSLYISEQLQLSRHSISISCLPKDACLKSIPGRSFFMTGIR